jgi:hypothetical protein
VTDSFNRPITTNPVASIDVLERVSYDSQKTMEILKSTEELPERLAKLYDTERHRMLDSDLVRRCINLGSYVTLVNVRLIVKTNLLQMMLISSS